MLWTFGSPPVPSAWWRPRLVLFGYPPTYGSLCNQSANQPAASFNHVGNRWYFYSSMKINKQPWSAIRDGLETLLLQAPSWICPGPLIKPLDSDPVVWVWRPSFRKVEIVVHVSVKSLFLWECVVSLCSTPAWRIGGCSLSSLSPLTISVLG